MLDINLLSETLTNFKKTRKINKCKICKINTNYSMCNKHHNEFRQELEIHAYNRTEKFFSKKELTTYFTDLQNTKDLTQYFAITDIISLIIPYLDDTSLYVKFNKLIRNHKIFCKDDNDLTELFTTGVSYMYSRNLLYNLEEFLITIRSDTNNLPIITDIIIKRLQYIFRKDYSLLKYGIDSIYRVSNSELNNTYRYIPLDYIECFLNEKFDETTFYTYVDLFLLFNWLHTLYPYYDLYVSQLEKFIPSSKMILFKEDLINKMGSSNGEFASYYSYAK